MAYLLDRMVVWLAHRRDDLSFVAAVDEWFSELYGEIERAEIEPRCRAIGKMLMFEGPFRNGGIEAYVSSQGWSVEDADDILEGYRLIKSSERAAVFVRVRDMMAAVTDEDLRGMASRQGFSDVGFGTSDETLNAVASELYLLDERDGDLHALTAGYLRQHGLVKLVLSSESVERAREAILARSPWHARLKAHRGEQKARFQRTSRRRREVMTELAVQAGVKLQLNSGYGVQLDGDAPKRGYVHKTLVAFDPAANNVAIEDSGERYMLRPEIVYYEDGERGVLATWPACSVLATMAIEPGSTDFASNWKLPS